MALVEIVQAGVVVALVVGFVSLLTAGLAAVLLLLVEGGRSVQRLMVGHSMTNL